MNRKNLISKAEMKKIMGGNEAPAENCSLFVDNCPSNLKCCATSGGFKCVTPVSNDNPSGTHTYDCPRL